METNPLSTHRGRKLKIPLLSLEEIQEEIRGLGENIDAHLQT